MEPIARVEFSLAIAAGIFFLRDCTALEGDIGSPGVAAGFGIPDHADIRDLVAAPARTTR